jgi:glycosyltransferase involved in cell wall biosynthesis
VRVLSISPYPVLPLTHGGRVRAYRLAVGLARAGASVELACPWHPGLPRGAFEREGITIRPFLFAANALPAMLGDGLVPPLLQLSWQPFTSGPRHLLKRARLHDIVEFHFCAYSAWMSRVGAETLVAYAAHNVELDYTATGSSSVLGRIFRRRLGALERRAVRASDVVVACTEADGKRLAEMYGRPKELAVVANGFDDREIWDTPGVTRTGARADLGLEPEELAVLFVGGPAAHNRRAVRFLENELLPRLARPARLLFAGQCARPRRGDGVLALGRVDSLRPLLAAADVAVNPMVAGSGSNVKLAEYLASGLPVVTTPVGLRGYEAYAHLVTVAELDEFADAIQSARRVTERRPELAELTWSALGRRLHDIYAGLLERRRRSRPR